MPCVSVVVSGDFYRFKLALPSLLSMSKDEVKSTPSHKTRDAFMNLSLAFSRDVSLGRLCLEL